MLCYEKEFTWKCYTLNLLYFYQGIIYDGYYDGYILLCISNLLIFNKVSNPPLTFLCTFVKI